MKKGYLTILNLIILQILTKKSSRLQFDQSNLFTVLQLTDLHLGESLLQDQQTYAVIDKLIHIAKPKLIAITGDLVSNYVSQSNDFALTHLKLLDKIFEQRKIYYFFVMGNHDHFLDISEQQFISFCEDKQFCLTQQNPVGRTNFYHYIYKQQKAVYVLWGFDGTVDYPDGWGEFQADQIKYITDSFQTILQNDSKITGIGFKHVPPKQFIETEKLQNLFGYKGQAIQCSSISIIEMVNRYNILKGLFVGHDHQNTFGGYYQNILLSYGIKTGVAGYKSKQLEGGRVVNLIFNDIEQNVQLQILKVNQLGLFEDEKGSRIDNQRIDNCFLNKKLNINSKLIVTTLCIVMIIFFIKYKFY